MQLVLVTGKGRSGTTWLAHALATHARCVYKHEPFLPGKPAAWREWLAGLETRPAPELRARFERLCRDCHAGVDEPFLQQTGMRRLPPRALRPLHRAARRVAALRPVYALAGRPRLGPGDAVLLKDVNFPNERLPRLCEVLEPALLAVLRNPFASVASLLRGVELGTFAPPRPHDVAQVRRLLGQPGHERLAHFRSQLDVLSLAEFEALRWRVQVEPLAAFATGRPRSRLVVYERLCEQPVATLRSLFGFLGWPWTDATRAFLDASVGGPKPGLDPVRAFYSVYRDPDESRERWKRDLDRAQQTAIAGIVKDSPILALWPELAFQAA